MPLIAAVDYPQRRIFLGPDSVGVEVLPIDIYTEMRSRRRINADNDRKFLPMVTAFGNERIGPTTSTPRFTDIQDGVRIVPFDTAHSLLIRGQLISRSEGLAGRDLFDRSSLTSEVDIDYQPPQVEVVQVSSGSGLDAEQDARLTNIDALLSTIEGDLDHREVMRILLSAMAGKGGGNGTAIAYRDLADTKDRIVAVTDGEGTRNSVTLDAS